MTVAMAGVLSPMRRKILETCVTWQEIKMLCEKLGIARTSVLHHIDVLMKSGLLEETVLAEFRTRKKLYRVKDSGSRTKISNPEETESPPKSN